MASSESLVKEASKSDKLLVEGCGTSVALRSIRSHVMDPTLTSELRNKVFGNDLIQEKIFDYVFTDSNGKLSIKDVLTCRQVDKTWLDYASYRLQKTGSPQFTIGFTYFDFLRSNKKMFGEEHPARKFLDTWTNVNHADAGSRIPLFNLNFDYNTADKSDKDRWQDLKNILTQCANGLHSLKLFADSLNFALLHIEDHSPPESFVPCFGQVHLPNLQILDVRLSVREIDPFVVAYLLATGVLGSKPLMFVPEFITNTNTQILQKLILANSLPNLTKLLLTIPLVGIKDEVIFKILDRFRAQLKHFTLFVCRPIDRVTKINFPVMPRLEYMSVCSPHYITLPGSEQSQQFPSLEILVLTEQTSSTFESWIQNLYFNSVKSLTVHTSQRGEDNFTFEMSRQLHTSFPFLQELDIAFGNFQDHSIRNIFQQMVNLRKLSIRIMHTAEITGASTWDAVLVGATPEYAATLSLSRYQWDSINLNDRRVPSHSIINLTHLECLTLNADNTDDNLELIISDVSFRFAFLCMPKLRELTFRGKFGASDVMMKQWRERGCEINCFCFKCTKARDDDDYDDHFNNWYASQNDHDDDLRVNLFQLLQ